MKTAIIALVVVILLGIFGPQTLYTVDETQITVVRRFGDIKAVNLNPGIAVKAPFIDSVTKLDKRLLRVDIPEATLPDVELQFLVIDAYVRYKIRRTEADAIKFFEKTAAATSRSPRNASSGSWCRRSVKRWPNVSGRKS